MGSGEGADVILILLRTTITITSNCVEGMNYERVIPASNTIAVRPVCTLVSTPPSNSTSTYLKVVFWSTGVGTTVPQKEAKFFGPIPICDHAIPYITRTTTVVHAAGLACSTPH